MEEEWGQLIHEPDAAPANLHAAGSVCLGQTRASEVTQLGS